MQHYKLEVKQKAIYVGHRIDWYGKNIEIKSFAVFYCTPINQKPYIKCSANIVIDKDMHTTCELEELIPIE